MDSTLFGALSVLSILSAAFYGRNVSPVNENSPQMSLDRELKGKADSSTCPVAANLFDHMTPEILLRIRGSVPCKNFMSDDSFSAVIARKPVSVLVGKNGQKFTGSEYWYDTLLVHEMEDWLRRNGLDKDVYMLVHCPVSSSPINCTSKGAPLLQAVTSRLHALTAGRFQTVHEHCPELVRDECADQAKPGLMEPPLLFRLSPQLFLLSETLRAETNNMYARIRALSHSMDAGGLPLILSCLAVLSFSTVYRLARLVRRE